MSNDWSRIEMHHEEVVEALRALPVNGTAGERIRVDRNSSFEHLGLRTPVRRQRVRSGFSFYDLTETEILGVWDGIWQLTSSADVMFAVLDFYRERLKLEIPPGFWPVAAGWIEKVDNWALADDLARVYSWALASNPDEVHASLVVWNTSGSEWHRRISIVSLIHYSGKGAVFVPPELVLPLVENCLSDHRSSVQKAVGWVLREIAAVYPDDVVNFIEEDRDNITRVALRRATERLEANFEDGG